MTKQIRDDESAARSRAAHRAANVRRLRPDFKIPRREPWRGGPEGEAREGAHGPTVYGSRTPEENGPRASVSRFPWGGLLLGSMNGCFPTAPGEQARNQAAEVRCVRTTGERRQNQVAEVKRGRTLGEQA